MADYPGSITDPRTVANLPGETYDATKTTRLYAEDINKANDEIVAIETTLGLNPQGDFDTVADRLDAGGGSAPSYFFAQYNPSTTGVITVTHGLGKVPNLIEIVAVGYKSGSSASLAHSHTFMTNVSDGMNVFDTFMDKDHRAVGTGNLSGFQLYQSDFAGAIYAEVQNITSTTLDVNIEEFDADLTCAFIIKVQA